MISYLEKLLGTEGHIVAIDAHNCRFGNTFRPVCLDDHCSYRGPLVSQRRAAAIGEEHRLKSIEKWRAAK